MFNIISFGKRKENLLLALETQTIGSALTTFKDSIRPGATVFLHCDGMIWGTAKVHGDYFYSDTRIWPDKVYPHRFKISLIKFARSPIPLSDGVINVKFRERFGAGWAYRFIFSPKPLPDDIAQIIASRIEKSETATADFTKVLEGY